MRDDSAVSSPSPSAGTRRRLLAFLGAGGVAALAGLFSRESAQAGHDGTNVLHLGEINTAPPGTVTGVNGNHGDFAFGFFNENTGKAGGIVVHSSGDLPGLQGNGVGSGPGVFGVSSAAPLPDGFAQGAGNGIQGASGSGTGVSGHSASGTGVSGSSDTGTGAVFTSGSGYALISEGPGGFGADFDGFALAAVNERTSASAGGFLAVSRGGKAAVEGDALPSEAGDGVGVMGISGSDETFGQGPGIGVQGISGTGVGVEARSENGLALHVAGRAAFSTVGTAVVPAGQSSTFVADPAVTHESHITVTLVGDPGSRQVRWIERDGGSGFTVHLSAAPPPARPATPLTYLVVEPG